MRISGLFLLCSALLFGQGLNTNASRDDWEEINFEFNSSILSDGYPSLLRLAELLQKNPDYKVTLEGNTDVIGSDRYNDKLSQARADTVKSFLVKYGARDGQISMVPRGKRAPKVPNTTKEGRFMNRRVTMFVRDGQGNLVSAGGVGDAIKALQAQEKQQAACCDEILKRLDKLDDILKAVQGLKAENDRLRGDLDTLRQQQAALQKQVEGLPRPPERAELQQMMTRTADEAIDKAKPNRWSVLGLNIGPTLREGPLGRFGAGNISVTGKGRYFAPFGKTETSALQAEGEYLYYRDRQEGQFDIGLLHRFNKFQLGLFNSMKHVHLTDLGGGTLGQGAVTADFVFSRGRIGMFGTKGYLDERVISRTPTSTTFNVFTEQYLKIVDQIGASTTVGAWNDAYFDANFGALFRRGGTNRPGGMFRLVQPINPQWAFTVEAGLNETMLGAKNTGRLVFGIQFGNWLRPKEYAAVRNPVPADIPRLRYEMLTRTVRTGNAPPVADAGPDQIGVAAGTVTLDASGSFDPDGDAITFAWSQTGGPSVSLTGANTARVTFPAAEGQVYAFRVTVRDALGAQAVDSVQVTTQAPLRLRIVRFTAAPTSVNPGDAVTLSWEIENAQSAEISGIGGVTPRNGTLTVNPAETTTYTLTARGSSGQTESQSAVVTVTRPQAQILFFQASPGSIQTGQSSTLSWQTQNADTVEISGIGGVAQNGTQSVTPDRTTTYTITARNRFGQQSTATATVNVTVPPTVTKPAPAIISFRGAPEVIGVGESATLTWDVENATDITIDNGVGTVNARGSQLVSPRQTTTYTLTANSEGGKVTATVTVRVLAQVRILTFTATPTAATLGQIVTVTWTTENAEFARLNGNPVAVNGSTTVAAGPAGTMAFVLQVGGNRTQDQKQITVTVTAPSATALQCSLPALIRTQQQSITLTPSILNPSGSDLTYQWQYTGTGTVPITGANTANAAVALGTQGSFPFLLTVRNAAGETCTASTVVTIGTEPVQPPRVCPAGTNCGGGTPK